MNIDKLMEIIRYMEVGPKHMVLLDERMPPEQIDNLLSELGFEYQIGEDWNGVDLDWSMNIEFEGDDIEFWGSGYSGTMCIQKNKNR